MIIDFIICAAISVGMVVYTILVGYIFWHIGYRRGFSEGTRSKMKFLRPRRSRNMEAVQPLPTNIQLNTPYTRPVFIERDSL